MNIIQTYYNFIDFIIPHLRQTRKENLSILVNGIIESCSVSICGIARRMRDNIKFIHKLKRVWRFISNEKLILDVIFI
jgi:hypothetical protein